MDIFIEKNGGKSDGRRVTKYGSSCHNEICIAQRCKDDKDQEEEEEEEEVEEEEKESNNWWGRGEKEEKSMSKQC